MSAGARFVVVNTGTNPNNSVAAVLLAMKYHDLIQGAPLAPARALLAAQRWLSTSDMETIEDYVDEVQESGATDPDWLWLSVALSHMRGRSDGAPFAHPGYWGRFTALASA